MRGRIGRGWEAGALLAVLAKIAVNLVLVPIYVVGLLVPRSRRIWVFGSWFGKRYADNSRYVFEYVRAARPDVRAVWLTRERTVLNAVRSDGGEAHWVWSPKGFWLACRAGLTFVTCSSTDVNVVALSRSKTVQLWHGTPLKKILADDVVTRNVHNQLVTRLRSFWRTVLPYKRERWDLVISPSDHVTPRLVSAFQVPATSVRVTGYPRGDVLLKTPPDPVPALTALLRQHDAQRVVCYAPTHRQEGRADARLLDSLPMDRLMAVLTAHRAVMVVRAHFYEHEAAPPGFSISHAARLQLLREADVPDLNHALPHTSVLITDYSSVMFDFLLLDRPIVFAPFDLDSYVRVDRELYDQYEEVTPGPTCRNWLQVTHALDEALAGRDEHGDARRQLRGRFNAYADTNNCRRVVAEAQAMIAI